MMHRKKSLGQIEQPNLDGRPIPSVRGAIQISETLWYYVDYMLRWRVSILPSSHLCGGDVNHETVQVVLHKAWEVLSAGRPGDTWQPFRCTKRGATPSKNDGGYHGNIMDYTQQSDGWVWTWLVSIPNENINSSTILAINHWKKGGYPVFRQTGNIQSEKIT